jgi:hypothetical protein
MKRTQSALSRFEILRHALNVLFQREEQREFIVSFISCQCTMAATTTNNEFPDLLENPAVPSTRAASNCPPRLIDLSSTFDDQTTITTDFNEDVSLSGLLDDDFSTVHSREDDAAFKGNSNRSDGTSETTGSESGPEESIGRESRMDAAVFKGSSTRSDGIPETTGSETFPKGSIGMQEFLKYEEDKDYEDSASEDSSESSFRSDGSENTSNILEKAHDRLALQTLKEEVEFLEATLESKDDEIEQLSGQLRRAVSTKCDLVLSHSELERFHESSLKKRDDDLVLMQQANYALLEMRANIEKEFMNELTTVAEAMEEEKKKHREEMDDWERLHRNEMREKEFKVAQLTEELRKATEGAGQSPSSGMKKKPFAGIFKHTP